MTLISTNIRLQTPTTTQLDNLVSDVFDRIFDNAVLHKLFQLSTGFQQLHGHIYGTYIRMVGYDTESC